MSFERSSEFNPTFPPPSPATHGHLFTSPKQQDRSFPISQQLAPDLQDSLLKLDDAISDNVKEDYSFNADRNARVQSGSEGGMFDRDANQQHEMYTGSAEMDTTIPLMSYSGEQTFRALNLRDLAISQTPQFSTTPLGHPPLNFSQSQHMINPTNDSYFGLESYPDQTAYQTFLSDAEPSFTLSRINSRNLTGEELDTHNLRAMDIFTQFHISLKNFLTLGHERWSPNIILDLAKSYRDACHQQLTIFDKLKQNSFSLQDKAMRELQQLYQRLSQEMHTWELIEYLHGEFVLETSGQGKTMGTGDLNGKPVEFVSEKRVIDHMIQTQPNIRRYQAVIQWLEHMANSELDKNPLKAKCLAKNICFENTLIELKNFRNQNKPVNPRLVTEIDADAPLRQKKQLSELDQRDELMLSQCIWHQIRAGRIEEAQKIYVKVGQSIKASLFEGRYYYHDPNFEVEPEDVSKPAPVEGNLTRDLWKYVVWRSSEETRFNVYDRAIYGSLCGNLSAITPACKNWEDWLWACYKVMLDVHFESEIRTTPHKRRGREPMEMPSSYWQQNLQPEIIFTDIQACKQENVRKYANSHFGMLQFYLITNQLEEMVNTMHSWIEGDSHDRLANPGSHLLRFITHLIIYCRQIELTVDDSKCDLVIEAYVNELIRLKQFDMVATYTARIVNTDQQIHCYSQLLQKIPDCDAQKRCLNTAKEAGLDTNLIVKRMVETVRGENNVWTQFNSQNLEKADTLTDLDERKIQVMDWLLYDKDQLPEALMQGLALIRLFLSANKYVAASKVFIKLPSDIIQSLLERWRRVKGKTPMPPDFENAIKEYLCFSAYFEAREAFDEWFSFFYQNRPQTPNLESRSGFISEVISEERLAEFKRESEIWEEGVDGYQQIAKEKIKKVLLFEGGWMLDEHDLDNEERRTQQDLLRRVCIPNLCFLLFSLQKECGLYQSCIRIANIVASGDYRLYELFTKEEFIKLLNLMKDVSVLLSERKEVGFIGYPV